MKKREGFTSRELQAQERRAQLIDTALDVFAAKGLDAATIKDLAEAAGVAQGLLYHYFRSKEELLWAVVERHGFADELTQILTTSHDRPAEQVLTEVVQGFYGLVTRKDKLVRVVLRESQTNPEIAQRFRALIRAGVELLSRYLAARVAVGELRPHNPEVVGRSLMYSTVMVYLTRGPAPTYLPELVDLALHGIKAQ